MMNAAIEQMDGVVSWTAFPGDAGLEAEQLLLDMRDQILGGQVSAKDGMTSTQDAINQLLPDRRLPFHIKRRANLFPSSDSKHTRTSPSNLKKTC